MKTATHNGKVYQIGKLYFMGGEFAELVEIDESVTYPFKGINQHYKSARTVDARDLGTIEDAPIELEDGEWYMCECGIIESRVNKPLLRLGEGGWSVNDSRVNSNLLNVKPLYKMVKST